MRGRKGLQIVYLSLSDPYKIIGFKSKTCFRHDKKNLLKATFFKKVGVGRVGQGKGREGQDQEKFKKIDIHKDKHTPTSREQLRY